MKSKSQFLLCLFLFLTLVVSPADSLASPTQDTDNDQTKNDVIVMGMIHGGHREHEVYNIDRVQELIRKIKPDYVLTEIPPDRLEEAAKQFRDTGEITESRVRVFPEYTEALFPLTKTMDFEIVPCAAWTKEMNDDRRAIMEKLKTTHADQYTEMQQAQQTASEKISTLGDSRNPAVIHTDQYDDFVKAGMVPYDEHFNDLIGDGGWENINAAHYALIEKALSQHSGEGKTFLITFGSWHKYYIKEQLAKRSDINQVSMQQFLSDTTNPDELLADFAKQWDESKWEQNFRGMQYMRATGNDDWQARMKVIHGLVANGEDSVPAIKKHLGSEHVPTRIIAAQAMSYLAKHADTDAVQTLFKNESDPAVRLYLADTLGMSGKGEQVDWNALAADEKNRDVKMHLNYAKERKGSAVDESVVKTLSDWDFDSMPTVVKDQPAPDFTLNSVDGKEFTLSQFKGVKPVVLVFIYGDT